MKKVFTVVFAGTSIGMILALAGDALLKWKATRKEKKDVEKILHEPGWEKELDELEGRASHSPEFVGGEALA